MEDQIKRHPRESQASKGQQDKPLDEQKKTVSPSLQGQAAEASDGNPLDVGSGLAPKAAHTGLPQEPANILKATKKIAIHETLNQLEEQLKDIDTHTDYEQKDESGEDNNGKGEQPHGQRVDGTVDSDGGEKEHTSKTGMGVPSAAEITRQAKEEVHEEGVKESLSATVPAEKDQQVATAATRAPSGRGGLELDKTSKGTIGQVERNAQALLDGDPNQKLPTPKQINQALMLQIEKVQLRAITKADALLMNDARLEELSPTQLIDFVTKLADLKLVLHWTSKLEAAIINDPKKLTAPGMGKATPLLSKLRQLSSAAKKELSNARGAGKKGKHPDWMVLPKSG